jgi:sulfane dehydrogenase subunit SoxC
MDSKQKETKQKPSSRRRFLKQGATLAGLAAVGSISARGQMGIGDGVKRPGFVPDDQVPKEAILKDFRTGEPVRDPEGNLVVDWTGTPQWEKYRNQVRSMGGQGYGSRDKDWRIYGYRSRYVNAYRLGAAGPMPTTVKTPNISMLSPLEHQTGVITPASLHFVDEHGYGNLSDPDPKLHRLRIYGMVDHPMTLTVDDIQRLPSVSRIHSVECNSDGSASFAERLAPWATPGLIDGEYSCSEWTGVLTSTLLNMVGVQRGAKWMWVGAKDDVSDTVSIPLAKGMDDAMICYGQNGEPLRPENGFPIRFLAPGFEGMRNIKRVARIKLMDEPGLFLRETSGGYTDPRPNQKVSWFRYEHAVKSMILKPSGGQTLDSKGFYEIRGIAWSGGGKITRVEITVDGGKTWADAEVQGPVHSKAATRFVFPWRWNGEECIIASRATDERGGSQPTTEQWARLWGVTPEILRHGKEVGPPQQRMWRFNVIQPWKIDQGGKITNAILTI